MIKFEVGQKYDVTYMSRSRYGDLAGELEVVAIRRVENPEYRQGSIRNCYSANVGEIDYIIRTEKTNERIKTAVLVANNNSESYANTYTDGIREYEWFSPLKRSYKPISSHHYKEA